MTAAFKTLSAILLLAALAAAQTGSGVVSGTWGGPPATGGSGGGGIPDVTQLATLPQCGGSSFEQSFCDARNPSPYPDTTAYAGVNPKITVCASGCTYPTVQAALNAVSCGTVISVKANQTAINQTINYSRSCDAAHWIIIRSDASDASLPPITQRLQPTGAHASLMGNLTRASSGAQSVVYVQNGAKYLWIGPGMNLDLEDTSGAWQAGGGVVLIGDYPTSLAQIPNHIVIDRSWLHGRTDNTTLNNGAVFHWGDFTLVQNSVIDHISSGPHTGSGGSCTVAGGCAVGIELSYGGPHKIYNNTINADGINIFHEPELAVGTQRPPDVTVAVVHDETISRNFLTKTGLNFGADQVANVLEWKEGNRVLVEGNLIEDSWLPFQVGHLITVNPDCGWYSAPNTTVAQNLSFRFNIARGAKIFLDLTAGDYGEGSGASNCSNPAALTGSISVIHNLSYDFGQNTSGSNPNNGWWLRGDVDGRYSAWQTVHPTINDLEIRHNTLVPSYTQSLGNSFVFDAFSQSSGAVIKDNILAGLNSTQTAYCSSVANPGGGAQCFLDQFSSAAVDRNAWVNASSTHSWLPATWGQSSCGTSPCSYYFNSPQNYSSIELADVNNCGKGTFSTPACAITSGVLKNGASDGTDVGADISAVSTATAHSVDGQW